MGTHGRTIKLFLIDGDASGRWTAELSNWTGKAYKIPRSMLKGCGDRVELRQPGVYFLFGRDDVEDRQLVYVGEAENVYERLHQHLSGKEFWNEAIAFISKDGNLNKAHIKYLEHHFHAAAINAKRYGVENSSVPTESSVSEPEEAELQEFMDNAKVVVSALGHRVFEGLADTHIKGTATAQEQLYFKKGNVVAVGKRHPEGFLVFAGATMNEKLSEKAVGKHIKKLREKLLADGKYSGESWKTTTDILFSSSSTAVDFLCGYSLSGPANWKDAKGKSLKEIEDAE